MYNLIVDHLEVRCTLVSCFQAFNYRVSYHSNHDIYSNYNNYGYNCKYSKYDQELSKLSLKAQGKQPQIRTNIH